jgi:hypothetical protein
MNGSIMKNIGSNLSDVEREIALFEALRTTVQQADLSVEGARGEALAYYIRTNLQIYGDQYNVVVSKFIEDLEALKKRSGNEVACEVSWALDRAIQVLFKTQMCELSLSNPKLSKTINAISALFEACKSGNVKLHAERKSVHFGGISRGFVPEWYATKILDSPQ